MESITVVEDISESKQVLHLFSYVESTKNAVATMPCTWWLAVGIRLLVTHYLVYGAIL